MFKKFSPPFLGFLQATCLVVYIVLIATFFILVTPTMHSNAEQFYAPIMMLLLFVVSAVISAVLVLGRAGVLFWDKKYKEAFTLIGWTVGWGLFYFMLIVLYLVIK